MTSNLTRDEAMARSALIQVTSYEVELDLVDGERLEGIGVDPTIAVPFDSRYAGGSDPQLDRALMVLSKGSG